MSIIQTMKREEIINELRKYYSHERLVLMLLLPTADLRSHLAYQSSPEHEKHDGRSIPTHIGRRQPCQEFVIVHIGPSHIEVRGNGGGSRFPRRRGFFERLTGKK